MLIIILFLIIALSIFYYKNKHVSLVEKKSEINTHDWYKETLIQYDIRLCGFDILQPEYVLITEEDILGDGELDYELLYYKIKNKLPFTSNWNAEYIGGTNVKNVTFNQLVDMVKKDCGQFQKSKGDHADETINWSYGEYIPEPEKTQEELEMDELMEKIQAIKDIHYILNEVCTEEMRQEIIEEYGDWKDLSDDELQEWYSNGPGAGSAEAYAERWQK